MTTRYNTDPSNTALETTSAVPDGRFPLAPGVRITLPLRDTQTGLRARMTFAQAETALRAQGLRLPTRAESLLLKTRATFIPWEALPTSAMCAAAGVDASNLSAVNTYRDNNMSSLEWARIEDAYLDKGRANSWDPRTPVLEAKWWFRDSDFAPPAGRAYLIGLLDPKTGQYIQQGAPDGSRGPHGANDQYDYATLTLGVDGPPITTIVPGLPPQGTPGIPGSDGLTFRSGAVLFLGAVVAAGALAYHHA